MNCNNVLSENRTTMPQRIPLHILTFLQNYKKHPCLWNRSHPNFKNRISREQAEEAILPITGLSTVKELRQKIRNIRCTYNQELSKIRRSVNMGQAEPYEPKLVWFAFADSFLRVNHMDRLEDQSSVQAFNSQQDRTCGLPIMKQEIHLPDVYYMPTETSPSDQSQDTTHSALKRLKMEPIDSNGTDRNGELEGEDSFASKSSNYTNEFAVFGQHVATQLQQLPLDDAIRLEEEIQCLITRTRLRCMMIQECS